MLPTTVVALCALAASCPYERCLVQIPGHEFYAIESVSISADSTKVVSGGKNKTIEMHNLADGAKLASFSTEDAINSVAYAPDATSVLVGFASESIKILDLPSGDVRFELPTPGELNLDCQYTPSGSELSCASEGLWIFDTSDGTIAVQQNFTTNPKVYSLAFSPDNKKVMTGGNATLFEWWMNGTQIADLSARVSDVVTSIEYHPKDPDTYLVASGQTATVYSASGNTEYHHDHRVTVARFSPDGEVVATGGNDNVIRLFTGGASDAVLALGGGSTSDVADLQYSPDGSVIVSCASNILVWNATIPPATPAPTHEKHDDAKNYTAIIVIIVVIGLIMAVIAFYSTRKFGYERGTALQGDAAAAASAPSSIVTHHGETSTLIGGETVNKGNEEVES